MNSKKKTTQSTTQTTAQTSSKSFKESQPYKKKGCGCGKKKSK